jgi:hypothetical protein
MNCSLIQGVKVTKESERLLIRNTWSVQALGGYVLILVGVGFFGCCGFMGLVPVEGKTPRDGAIGTVLADVGIPLAALGLLALPVRAFRHRRPFVFDRQADRFLDGGREICPLSDIRSISVDAQGFDPTEYVVRFVRADGRKLRTLEMRLDEFRQREDAARLAAVIADFLSIEVVGVGQGRG